MSVSAYIGILRRELSVVAREHGGVISGRARRHPWLRWLARLLTWPMPRPPPPALAAAPAGFTVADLTAKAGAMTGQQDYTGRRAGYLRVITQIG